MAQERGTHVESIKSVLEIALTQQKSCLVKIEHIQAGQVEQGEIYLLAGQPIYARAANRLLGQEALNLLLSWRSVHVLLAVNAPRPPANISVRLKREQPSSPLNTVASAPFFSEGKSPAPRKAGQEREGLAQPLTRRQRLLYFLVNGERTVPDLARTSGQTIVEVELTLNELQKQGLVVC